MAESTSKLQPLEVITRLAYGQDGERSNGGPVITPDVERCQTPQEVIEYARKRGLTIVDYKFTDLFGRWHHFSMPIHQLTEEVFEEGLGFDGSSIRAFQGIHESDMILFPDTTTAVVDPVLELPTLSLTCNIYDPVTGEPYNKDARWVAMKAERFLVETGIGDVSYWGPEAEFFVFDGVRFDYQTEGAHFAIESDMASWEQRRGYDQRWGSNLGYRPEVKRGYFRVPPVDKLQDWRSEAILRMMLVGMDVEVHHGEVASAGQQEIDLKYSPLVRAADQLQWYKYILKNVAVAHGKTVTFMPKPMFEDNGSGMHCHQSVWKDGANQFYDADGYSGLSQIALWYIGGIIKHTPAMLGLVAPSTNSYKRLVPGYEAPVMMAYSMRNRSACVRIPVYSASPKAKRIEYRPPDATGNPYLTFAAMLMAGLDGIINQTDPGSPMDIDLYEAHDPNVPQVPGSLDAVLTHLEEDHEFLLRGDVFTKDLLEVWIEWKRKHEVDAIRMRTHPYEYVLYYDV
jgi:glutamine synthetase